MNSYKHKNVIFHFNSDFSGDVIIIKDPNTEHSQEIEIPGEALLALVAYEYIMPEKISKIESMDFKEILKSVTK